MTSLDLSQLAVAILRDGPAPLRTGQVAVEVLGQGHPALHLSQTAIEVLRSNTAPAPTPPARPFLWVIT